MKLDRAVLKKLWKFNTFKLLSQPQNCVILFAVEIKFPVKNHLGLFRFMLDMCNNIFFESRLGKDCALLTFSIDSTIDCSDFSRQHLHAKSYHLDFLFSFTDYEKNLIHLTIVTTCYSLLSLIDKTFSFFLSKYAKFIV